MRARCGFGWSALALVALAACGGGFSGTPAPSPAVLAADSSIRLAMANERTIDPASLPPRTVAVAPFRIHTTDTSLAVLGYGLADFLITDLSRSRQLQVVDRLRIDAFVREMRLVEAGVVDSAGAAQFGRIIGARRIVLGSLTTADADRARLDGRVGDVSTGVIENTAAAPTTLDALLEGQKAFAFAVFDRLGVTLTPAERALIEQRRTRSLAALLAYSRGVRAELLKDYRGAREQYRAAARIDGGFEEAESRASEIEAMAGSGGTGGVGDLTLVSALAINSINSPTLPQIQSAADPAFRQRLFATIIIILQLP